MCVLPCYLCIFTGTEIHSRKLRQAGANKALRFVAPHTHGIHAFVYQTPLKVWQKKKSFFKPLLSSHKQSGMRRKKIRLPKLLLWINRHSTWPFSFSIPLFNQADAERFELTGRVRRQSLITLLKHQHVLCDMKPRAVRASINLNDRCWDTQLVYDPQTSHSVWPFVDEVELVPVELINFFLLTILLTNHVFVILISLHYLTYPSVICSDIES